MSIETVLSAAIEAKRPEIAAEYKRLIRVQIEKMRKQLGPKLQNVTKDWTWAKVFRSTLKPSMTRVQGVWSINEAALDENAASYADAAIENWQGKILAKLVELDNAEVQSLDCLRFVVTGTRQGKAVSIAQNCVVNFSKNGAPYNQFPARIKVDGKVVSEMNYKRMFE